MLKQNSQIIRVALVGLGGVGQPFLWALARSQLRLKFISLFIFDPDTVDQSNMARQFHFEEHHLSKAKTLAFSDSSTFKLLEEKLKKIECFKELFGFKKIKDFDWIVDCSDDPKNQWQLSKQCVSLNKNYFRLGAVGLNAQLFLSKTKSLAEFFGEEKAQNQENCQNIGIFSSISLIAGFKGAEVFEKLVFKDYKYTFDFGFAHFNGKISKWTVLPKDFEPCFGSFDTGGQEPDPRSGSK